MATRIWNGGSATTNGVTFVTPGGRTFQIVYTPTKVLLDNVTGLIFNPVGRLMMTFFTTLYP